MKLAELLAACAVLAILLAVAGTTWTAGRRHLEMKWRQEFKRQIEWPDD